MSDKKFEYKFIRLDPKDMFLIDDDYKPKKFWTLNTRPEIKTENYSSKYQTIINATAKEGWRLVEILTVPEAVTEGGLGVHQLQYVDLIFEKEIS